MNKLDHLITTLDLGLRTVFASPHAGRPYPGTGAEAEIQLPNPGAAARYPEAVTGCWPSVEVVGSTDNHSVEG